jgi:hypothetical protein
MATVGGTISAPIPRSVVLATVIMEGKGVLYRNVDTRIIRLKYVLSNMERNSRISETNCLEGAFCGTVHA